MSIAGLSIGFGTNTVRLTRRQITNRYFACLREMAIVEQDLTTPDVERHFQRLAAERKQWEAQLTERERARVSAAYSRWYFRFLA